MLSRHYWKFFDAEAGPAADVMRLSGRLDRIGQSAIRQQQQHNTLPLPNTTTYRASITLTLTPTNMPSKAVAPFATFLIVGPTCFFLGILFALFPYDYHVLWTTPTALLASAPTLDPKTAYFALQENHLKFLHASPPLISRMLHIVIGVGLLGFTMKLYKPSEANMLFDGASLVLYMCGITVYITNIVKGLRTVTAGAYGGEVLGAGETMLEKTLEGREGEFIGREDSLKVLAASNTILALVLIGVLVLQAGQWYAQRKEAEELEEMDEKDKVRDEKRKEKHAAAQAGKKKQ